MPLEPAATPTKRTSLRPFQQFVQGGTWSGVLLLLTTALALGWANSPWQDSYFALWERRVAIGPEPHPMDLTLHQWLNDGLMAVFFLLVGLEIKRELLVGELSSRRQAALPIAAAAGGMVVPASIYWLLNPSGAAAAGWGIPMATDIAFALGVLTLLGPRVPLGLKVFLTALAIVDDLGAVLVIALFYTGAVDLTALAVAAAAVAVLVAFNRAQIRHLAPYLLVGLVLWFAVHESGLHATIAGVLLAFTVPSRTRINAAEFSTRARELIDEFDRAETGDLLVITSKGQQEAIHALEGASEQVQAPLLRLEHALHSVVQFGIMPLFAMANAGVRVVGSGSELVSTVTLGVALGLLFGKPIGIAVFSWLAVRMGVASLPSQTTWSHVRGAAWLGGIGFTMSLFIAGLAFGGTGMLAPAKAGILMASTLAGVAGALSVRRALR